MRELLMQLLVEHGDREFVSLGDAFWSDDWYALVEEGYLEDNENLGASKITPKGLEYLKNA